MVQESALLPMVRREMCGRCLKTKDLRQGRMNTEQKYARTLRRLWAMIDKGDPSGCWMVSGNKSGKYTQIVVNGKRTFIHRFVYELLVGPIPEGYDLGHKCHDEAAAAGLCDLTGYECPHHSCCNPLHLEPQPRATNLRSSPNTQASINGSKTHCKYGHEYTEENTGRRKTGWRYCRQCGRERSKIKSV